MIQFVSQLAPLPLPPPTPLRSPSVHDRRRWGVAAPEHGDRDVPVSPPAASIAMHHDAQQGYIDYTRPFCKTHELWDKLRSVFGVDTFRPSQEG